MTLSIGKILLILGIGVLFFGYKKLPELGKGLGEAIRNFKKGLNEPEAIDITPKADEPAKNTPEADASAPKRPAPENTPR